MFLGVDIGTSSVKSILMGEDQRVLGSSSSPLEVDRQQPGWSEQNAQSWWLAVCNTIDLLTRNHPENMRQVRGIGLSGQMHGATLLDKQDKLLRPVILWNDTRSAIECEQIEREFPDSRAVSGNIAMAGFTAPKLAWIRKHEAKVFDRIAKVLLPKDYIRLRLSGEYVSEMSDASGTLWLDVKKRRWSDQLLAATGLTQAHMPNLIEGCEISGYLKENLRKRWGIRQKVVIAGGAGDNAASACAMGTISTGRAFVSLGTSGVLFAANDRFSPNTDSAVHAFCHALPAMWHQMGVILSASDSLQWLARIVSKTPAQLTANLGNKLISPSAITFLPYLGGERTPHNDPDIQGAMIGLRHAQDLNDLTQAVLEGVAYAFRDNHEALKQAGTDFETAFVVGGGGQSELWVKIIASVLNRSLQLPQSGETGAAFGAARLALCATDGADPLQVCSEPQIKKTIEPELSLVEHYQRGYERYRTLYPAIRSV